MNEYITINYYNRNDLIDALRGWATFLVVLGHSVTYYPINLHETVVGEFLYSLAISVHIPLFFLLSGYCYRIKNTYKEYIIGKIFTIVIPYFVFNILDMIFRSIFSNLVNRPRGIVASIKKMLFFGGEYWFLYVLFIILLVYPIIDNWLDKSKKLSLLLLLVLMIISAFDSNYKTFIIRGVLRYLFWFHLGKVLKEMDYLNQKNAYKKNYSLPLAIISFFIWSVFTRKLNIDFFCKDILVALLGVVFARLISDFFLVRKLFVRYGINSLQIYLLNGFFLVISRTILNKVLQVSDPFITISFNVSINLIFVNWLIENFIKKLPIVPMFMGMKKNNLIA